MGRSLKVSHSERGQALLLAVMIMLAILLMGTLFVAVVNYGQRSSGRHAQLLKAMTLAGAGIEYANKMLQFSPDGLDWRPPTPEFQYSDGSPSPLFWGHDGVPYTSDDYYSDQELLNGWYAVVSVGPDGNGGTTDDYYIRNGFTRYPDMSDGHFLLRVTYDPDPPFEPWQEDDPDPIADPLSRHIKIESIGVVETGGFVFRNLQAYKPTVLTDYLLFVSDQTQDGLTTSLGFDPLIDMNNDGDLTDAEDFFSPEYPGSLITYTYNGPIRSNTDLEFYGANRNGAAGTAAEASNRIVLAAEPLAEITGQVFSIPLGGGYCRDDFIECSGLVSDEQYASATEYSTGLQLVGTAGSNWYDLHPDRDTNQAWVDVVKDGIPRLNAPDLFAEDPATGTMRWDPLSRQSGEVVVNPSDGLTYNTGQFGQGRGIYVDNDDDIQFEDKGEFRIDWLIQDWLHNLASGTTDSGWNEPGEVYDAAPAVRIELFPDEDAVLEWAREAGHLEGADLPITDLFVSGGIPSYPPPPAGSGRSQLWWPGHINGSGEPGIVLIRDANDWQFGDPTQPGELGTPTGTRLMCRDYPNAYPPTGPREYPVIFAEGNVRIEGRLPRADDGPTGYPGRYNLTVVSRGTIYVDGQILSPQDQWGRQVSGDSIAGLLVSDQDNTYIGLLARDCVVVNPTVLVPQWTSKTNDVTPQPDEGPTDPNKHWEFAVPPVDVAQVTSAFSFGHTATTKAGANAHKLQLVAYQTLEVTSHTTLTAALSEGDIVLHVADASGFMAGQSLRITPVNVDDEYPPEDGVNVGVIDGPPVGNDITLLNPVPAGENFLIGDWVENATALDCTGANLDIYNPLLDPANRWQHYDFYPGSDEFLFLLTRKDLSPDEPWFWEVKSPWCPLLTATWMLFDATGASSDYLGISNAAAYPGMANYARFTMPAANDITTANGGDGAAQNYWLKKFKIQELDDMNRPVGAIHAKINALMYAQDGCFFVIPCRYFKEDASQPEPYLRYNYDIEIRGAITENFHPGPTAVREWQEKWAYPAAGATAWNSIRYIYDETLLAAREQAVTELTSSRRYAPNGSMQLNLVKVPLLPASADLLYYGEAQ